ncbi:hypothetical protein [Mesorhizobium sp. INR15]|uniref:hypothetical protein n=1 Tax=Mesorhizobium sp. INR15 TaxID=2654248 RepID=UPI0018967A9F|nr:hypothetical protein [Mesorhizobium sp. INR15]QPC91485.1 hypothetical protein GA829_13170 [Mesorhizobium sp. INR15]
MTYHTFNRADLAAFKSTWPCHGLPDSLNSLTFEFGSNGDLVDIEAKARNGRQLDSAAFDGSAMVALSQDGQKLAAEPMTPVLFRIDRSGKHRDVTAVFPTLPSDAAGRFMTCYAHIGQHGSASHQWYVSATRPATAAEYSALKSELESAPYNYRLQVCQRMTAAHRDAFNAALCRQ